MSGGLRFYDIHSHILPGVDDGAKDINTSLAMLAESKRQGCFGIVATSHYYRKESIQSFLERRAEAFERLMRAVHKEDPYWEGRIALGAEVAYHRTLVQDTDLLKLRYGHSDYLLLEPPFVEWPFSFLRDVQWMTNGLGMKIIIAHFERYRHYTDKKALNELLEMDVTVQMDAGEFLDKGRSRRAVKAIRKGMVDVFGSDMHNTSNRPANIGPALEALLQTRAADHVEQILENNKKIFTEAIGREMGE